MSRCAGGGFSVTQRRAARSRGFTLVELMVALSGGLLLSVIVFALARDTSRFYQRENRVASATLAGMVGFERLKADIQRAGYLVTPNIQRDPRIGALPGNAAPAGLQTLAALRIHPDTPALGSNPAFAANASAGQTLSPDELILAGSYAATDEFPVSEASTGDTIYLQYNTPSMARLGYIGASAAAQTTLLANVFGVGRLLRVVDQAGQHHYGVISGVSGGNQPSITLSQPLPLRPGSAGSFGLRGYEVGASANVVNRIRYRIASITADARWAPLIAASSGAPGEADRTELMRDELDADDAVIAGSSDIVAEYAVDLGFGVTGQVSSATPSLVYSEPGDTNFATFFAANDTGDRPHGVRAVRVRLSVRSREADREANIPGGGLYRFKVGAEGGWARVRTFQADVALPNVKAVPW